RRDSPDRRLGGGALVPRLLATADEDASLMALAGQQDRVSRPGTADGMGDPLPAILDPCVLLALGPADLLGSGGNFVEDGHRVLFPRILVGEDRVIAQSRGDLPHPGPLLAIAVTGAAEDGDQLPAGDGPQLTKHLLQALRRMGVIDDDAKRRAEVAPRHPAADAALPLQPLTDLVERQPDGNTRGSRSQRVRGVPAAAQLQPQ